jgi:hypothetical protein
MLNTQGYYSLHPYPNSEKSRGKELWPMGERKKENKERKGKDDMMPHGE